MNPNRVIQLAMKTGSLLLESGAETYRVEDTVVRICNTYGMSDTSCFCTQTGIMLSSVYDGNSFAQVARIQSRSTNLDRIGNLNQLSRDAKVIALDDYAKRLDEIVATKTYSLLMNIVFAGICTFGFTLINQGSIQDAIAGFTLGGIVRFCTLYLENKGLNSFFTTSGCAFIITMSAVILESMNLITNRNTVIVGAIMLLVPGLSITNALRDSIAGDLVSGTARAVEAFLIAVAVAVGSGIAMTIWLSLGGII